MTSVNYDIFGRFSEELLEIDSMELGFKAYERCIQKLGFDAATYTFLSYPQLTTGKGSALPAVFLRTDEFPEQFIHSYVDERFERDDFTLPRILAGDMEIMDWQEFERNRGLASNQQALIRVAREDFKIRNALSIPTMSNDIGAVGASIISSKNNAEFQRLKEQNLATLVRCTQAFHQRYFKLTNIPHEFVAPFLESLNEKEIAILRHLADGKPLKQIEYSVDVASPKVASNMLDKIRSRFGGVTRDKLMFLVGELNILQYYKDFKKPDDKKH